MKEKKKKLIGFMSELGLRIEISHFEKCSVELSLFREFLLFK